MSPREVFNRVPLVTAGRIGYVEQRPHAQERTSWEKPGVTVSKKDGIIWHTASRRLKDNPGNSLRILRRDADVKETNILQQQIEKDVRWQIYRLFSREDIDRLFQGEGVTREQYLRPSTLQRIRRFFRI